MNELVFNNTNLNLKVRTVLNDDGSISINAEDTAIGFGWTEFKDGKEYIRWRTLNNFLIELGFSQQVAKDDYIPESLFYMLGMKANNKVALEFQKWLSIDVLPTIRKTGTYTAEKTVYPKLPTTYKEALVQLLERVEENEELQQQIEEQRPKVIFANSVSASNKCILIRELSKYLRQNKVDIGEKRLYKRLREEGYLIKLGNDYNMPTQRSADMELFKIKKFAITNSDGETKVKNTVMVTPKGQVYFVNKFLKDVKIEQLIGT